MMHAALRPIKATITTHPPVFVFRLNRLDTDGLSRRKLLWVDGSYRFRQMKNGIEFIFNYLFI